MPTRFSIGNSSSSEDDDGEGPSIPPTSKKHKISFFQSSGDEVDDDEDGDVSENPEDEELQEENDDDPEELSRLDAEEEEQEVVEEENCVEYHTIAEQEDGVLKFGIGKHKNRDAVGPRKDGSISATLTDPDVLDCPVCVEPLTIPVFQCENGHTACSSCCSKLRNKCSSCSLPIGYNRCRAIEKVLQSIIISCRNMKYGCKETVSYSKKLEHERTCIHEPCSCPHPGCDFVGSYKQLYLHFDCKHPDSATPFCFDSFFTVPIKTDMKFVILQEHVDSLLFILNYGVQSIGNVANITCIAPSSLKKGFSYELIARNGDNSVKLESFTESIPRWSQHLPQKAFLMVPSDFLGSSKLHHFQVCIRRNKEVLDRTPNT